MGAKEGKARYTAWQNCILPRLYHCLSDPMQLTKLSDLLAPYLVPSTPTRHRLFHGRGKTVPALEWLTIDCFAPVLVATVFRAQDDAILQALEASLTAALVALGCDTLVVQHRYDGQAENVLVCGQLPESPLAEEDGLVYKLDFQR